MLASLLAPLGAYHKVFQRVCVKLEPALQWLDFSVRGYMMSKPIDNQCKWCIIVFPPQDAPTLVRLKIICLCLCWAVLRRPIHGAASGEASDSEEELAAFCPTVSLSNFSLQA